jgi:Xaa-Pro dipeptidase
MQYGPYAVDYENRPYNPERMRNERIAKAQASLKKHGLGAMMVFDYDYQRYLGYYSSHQYNRRRLGHFALLIEGDGFPYCPKDYFGGTWDQSRMPWFNDKMILETSKTFAIQQALPEHPNYVPQQMDKMVAEVKALLVKHGRADMPIGIDISNYDLIRAFDRSGLTVCDGLLAMTDAMQIKTPDEIHCMRMAGVIAESAHWEVCKALRPGMTELQIAGIAANACFKLGAEELEGPSFVVCSGERSGHVVPNMPTDRIVRPGDFVVIDINGVSFQGYRTCFYRTYLVGDKPTQFQKDVYKVCRDGLAALTACVKPGITTADISREWQKMGDFPGGWGRTPKWPDPGRRFAGSVMHSIGLRSGDGGPTVAGFTANTGYMMPPVTIQENMTFAVEVGCFTWLGNKWAKDGVKIEHCGVVTKDGFDVFYRAPKDELIVCGLPGTYFSVDEAGLALPATAGQD